MNKKILVSIFILSVFTIPRSFVFAVEGVVGPIINTAPFAINYHHYIDDWAVDVDEHFAIIGSNFGSMQGKIINLDNNNVELLTRNWSDTSIQIYTKENAGKLLLGTNRFILKTSDGVESDTFTINFEKYWIGPHIKSVTPTPVHLSDEVEIIGENFGDRTTNNGIVHLGSEDQQIISWTETKIKIKVQLADWNKATGLAQGYVKIRCNGVCRPGYEDNSNNQFLLSNSLVLGIVEPPPCASDTWSCGSWNACSIYGLQIRNCTKTFDCPATDTPSPATSQSCGSLQPQQPTQPSCSADIWQCGDWNSCSPNGIQTRSCKRTYDCSSVETPPPATSQYCQAPNQPQTPSYSAPSSGNSSAQPNSNVTYENTNQDTIVQSTVKLICLVNATSGMQGSGTVIDLKGIILTNRHVVEGTKGCVVGFINNAEDDPSYTEVADIVKLSTDEDIALIKIRNDGSKSFVYSDISSGSVNSKNLGNKIMIFGYPSIGGAKLNYSDGAVSGFGSAKDGLGNYLKTTAMIEHGNSGGGAYLMSNNYLIGIPSAGIKGELASIGYILSVNKIKSWLSGSGLSYNSNGFKNLSSKSIKASIMLENVDLENINLLDVSSANVSIYSNKSKTTLLPNNPGTIQTFNKPTFQINNIDEESDIIGYYVYFGTNMKADPVKKGKYIKKSEYAAATSAKGIYFFIFRAKDSNGIISEPVITEYRYKK